MNNAVTLFVAGLLALLSTFFLIRLVVAIGGNLKTGRRYRQSLARRVRKYRLAKMLQALGINLHEYLAGQNVNAIHRQLENCARCEQTRDCDELLAADTVTPEQLEFCNNERELVELAARQAEASAEPAASTNGAQRES